ncbi:hypothetical protein, partial [Escherichia coli]|uniref:hypothetical protein n=1 Tax=Escherichia coli TaxID=562 RepID=UPI0028E00691
MENSRENKITDKYKDLLSVATDRVNIHSGQLGSKDFDIQYRLLEYTEAENGRKIQELQKKIDDMTVEIVALRELHHLAQ